MKKTSLLLGAVALAFSASAQTAVKSDVFGRQFEVRQAAEQVKINPDQAQTRKGAGLNKATSATERWYDFFHAAADREGADFSPGGGNGSLLNIWFDSTIRQRFTSGLGTVNYSSVMHFFDPINTYGMLNDPNLYLGELKIDATKTYKVDSVACYGAYMANLDRPGGVVDTLIVTVAPASPGVYRSYKTQYNNAQYLPAGADSLVSFTQYKVDSNGRTIWSDIGDPVADRYTVKVPLTALDRDTATSSGIAVKYFIVGIPNGGLTIPAGRGFSVAYTFKSGDTWEANVDSITSRHRWMPYTAEVFAGSAMPYYYYDYFPTYPISGTGARYGERSMANLMFSTSSSRYVPTILIESWNSNDFRTEFVDIEAHLTCDSCGVVTALPTNGINQVTNFASVAEAYPNPATNVVNLSFITKQAASVNAVITNMTGQTVMAQTVGDFSANQSGKATFSTANLSNGMYFITVESQGQRVTKRFVIAK